MSLNSILGTAASGLFVAQTGMNAVSDNVANVNTPGYAQKQVNQVTLATDGVSVASITRAANQFLQNAALTASASVGQTGAISNLMSQAQALFGDPSSSSGYFSTLNQVFSDFTAAANDPSDSLDRNQAINDLSQFLDASQNISGQLSQLSGQADGQISADVSQANQLLSQISQLNSSIVQGTAMGQDVTDSQNQQSALINQLSSLMDLKVTTNASGAVTVSTTGGVTLVGQGGAASLSYTPGGAITQVDVTQPGGDQAPTNLSLANGEIQGLLSLRNVSLPGVADQLSEYVSGAVNAINAAHNAATAVPAPQQLTGTANGVDLQTAISGFSGITNVAIVDGSGDLVQQVQINFSAGTMSVNGGAATGFTPATFLSSLNTALGGQGAASFTNGALSIAATTAGDGVAIGDDAATPSQSSNGEGFSQYFGLNNLITSSTVTNYQTGLSAADPSNFPAGQTITLGVSGANGSPITDVTITTPGGTVQNLIDTLNANPGGVGLYGQFSLSAEGALTFTPTTPGSASISVIKDQTASTQGGVSVSQLFGIGAATAAQRTDTYAVRPDIVADPTNLALASLNLNAAAAGDPVVSIGDGGGGLGLAAAAHSTVAFNAAGAMPAMSTTISQYAALLGGQLGNAASAATTANTNAQAVQTEANTRLQSVEGVNLDQELVNLTTYQQAYNASARLITATQDMFNTLMTMVGQ